jgi:hypothetical protein
MSDLEQIATDLRYAAGAGANRLRETVLMEGRNEANIGQALGHSPGLGQLLGTGRRTIRAEGATVPVSQIADHMSQALADGGAALVNGAQ